MTFSAPAMKKDKIAQHANLIALFTGLVFVAHPVQTEAVTYIWQRAASMAALFYLASLCFYVKSRLQPPQHRVLRRIYYISSLMMVILAMFTKENAITLPLMILIYESIFLKTKKNLDWKYLAPFLLTLCIIPLTFLLSKSEIFQDHHGNLQIPGGVITPLHYFLTEFRVMITYIRLCLFPFNQTMDYDYPIFKSVFELPVFFSILFLISILYGAKRLLPKYRLISFSIFWFFLTLAIPESSFWEMGDVILEYRLYLPLAGFSLFLVSSAYYLLEKNSIRTMTIVLLGILAGYSLLTYQRNMVWKDEFTLWDDAVKKSPHKARAYNNRGSSYSLQGNLMAAMSDYTKAIELFPDDADSYYNRGTTYYNLGNLAQAIVDYNKAIELSPNDTDAYYNRGFAYYSQGNLAQAVADYSKVINISPSDADTYARRGLVYYHQGKIAQAIADYNSALAIDPHDADAYANRGNAYASLGNLTQALADYTKVIEINPGLTQVYYNRAIVYYQLKNYGNAWGDVLQAEKSGLTVSPDFIRLLKIASHGLEPKDFDR